MICSLLFLSFSLFFFFPQILTRQWLWERIFCTNDVHGIYPQHYAAYQHLRNSGYPVRRWKRRAPTPAQSLEDATVWKRMMESEEGIENGSVVFEAWTPPTTSNFKRSNPPPSHWRILPWTSAHDFGAALAWSKAAGTGAMMALSGAAATRCSFLQVVSAPIGRNPRVPAPRNSVLQQPSALKRAKLEAPAVVKDNGPRWFVRAQEWGQRLPE